MGSFLFFSPPLSPSLSLNLNLLRPSLLPPLSCLPRLRPRRIPNPPPPDLRLLRAHRLLPKPQALRPLPRRQPDGRRRGPPSGRHDRRRPRRARRAGPRGAVRAAEVRARGQREPAGRAEASHLALRPGGLEQLQRLVLRVAAAPRRDGAAECAPAARDRRLGDRVADRLLAALRRRPPGQLQRRPGDARGRRGGPRRARRGLPSPAERGPAPDGLAAPRGRADVPQAVGRRRQRRGDDPRGVHGALRRRQQVRHLRLRREEAHRAVHRLLGRREKPLPAVRLSERRRLVFARRGGVRRRELRGVRSVRGQEEEVWGQRRAELEQGESAEKKEGGGTRESQEPSTFFYFRIFYKSVVLSIRFFFSLSRLLSLSLSPPS